MQRIAGKKEGTEDDIEARGNAMCSIAVAMPHLHAELWAAVHAAEDRQAPLACCVQAPEVTRLLTARPPASASPLAALVTRQLADLRNESWPVQE